MLPAKTQSNLEVSKKVMYGKKFCSSLCILFLLAAAVSAKAQNNKPPKIQKNSDIEAATLLKLGIGIEPIELKPEVPSAEEKTSLRISGTAAGCAPTNLITRVYGNYIQIETEVPTDALCTTEIKEWSHIVSLGILAAGEHELSVSIRSGNDGVYINKKINVASGRIPTAKIETIPETPKSGDIINLKVSGTTKSACVPQNPQLSIDGYNITFSSEMFEDLDKCAKSDGPEVPWEFIFPINHLWHGYYKIKATYRSGDLVGAMGEGYLYIADDPATDPVTEPTTDPAPTDEPTTEPGDEPMPEPTEEPAPEPTEEPTTEPGDEPMPEPTTEPAPESTTETSKKVSKMPSK